MTACGRHRVRTRGSSRRRLGAAAACVAFALGCASPQNASYPLRAEPPPPCAPAASCLDLAIALDSSARVSDPLADARFLRNVTWRPAPGDPLGLQLEALREVVPELAGSGTAVTLLAFWGAAAIDPYADHGVLVPLTRDLTRVDEAAQRVATGVVLLAGQDVAKGLDRILVELVGLRNARSSPRAESRRAAILVTAGLPRPAGTLESDRRRAEERMLRSLSRVRRAGVELHWLVLPSGGEAAEWRTELQAAVGATGGALVAVRDRKGLVGELRRILGELGVGTQPGATAAPQ